MLYDMTDNTVEEIKLFLDHYRKEGGVVIAFDQRKIFCEDFYALTGIRLCFNSSPLSVVETLCLALSVMYGYDDIIYMLGLSKPRILAHERRAKHKFQVSSKLQAVCMAVQEHYIRIEDW